MPAEQMETVYLEGMEPTAHLRQRVKALKARRLELDADARKAVTDGREARLEGAMLDAISHQLERMGAEKERRHVDREIEALLSRLVEVES